MNDQFEMNSPESPLSHDSPLPFNSNNPNPVQEFPPPPTQQVQSSTELINQLLQLRSQQDVQLRTIREQQKFLFENPTAEAYQTLHQTETELKAALDAELQNLDYLEQILLTPGELHRLDYLRNEFHLQTHQTELFITEIEQLGNQRRVNKPYIFFFLFSFFREFFLLVIFQFFFFAIYFNFKFILFFRFLYFFNFFLIPYV